MKFDLEDPRLWPTWPRRIFLLGLPVTLPLWFVTCLIYIVVLGLLFLLCIPAAIIVKIWEGEVW